MQKKKNKVDGTWKGAWLTFQNIFSSIAVFRDRQDVVSVLPWGKKNLCGCAEKANQQWAFVDFVAFWLSPYVEPETLTRRLRLEIWLAPKTAHFSV